MIKERKLLSAVQNHLFDKRHTIITGARQVGKTSLLRLIYNQLESSGVKVYFLNLEDLRILEAVNYHPEKIFDFVKEQPTPSIEKLVEEKIFLLIDEIQYADDPTNFLKYIYDKYEQNVKIIATGSSAFYMDKKFKDSLAGRKRIFQLFTLSFEEFLFFKNEEILIEEFEILQKRNSYQSLHIEKLKQYFREYIIYGGYPAVVLEDDYLEKENLLSELKSAYVKRDLLESGVEKEGKFLLLFQLLADQVGNLVNKNELANTVQLDSKTIDNYLYILQNCFHIQLIRPFFRNLRKELTKMPKVFFNDLGLRNSFLNRFNPPLNRADKGALLENYFFLRFREKYNIDQIKFWRTSDKQEIDFVIEESFGEGKAYEIKWNCVKFNLKKYQKFANSYDKFSIHCLDSDQFYAH